MDFWWKAPSSPNYIIQEVWSCPCFGQTKNETWSSRHICLDPGSSSFPLTLKRSKQHLRLQRFKMGKKITVRVKSSLYLKEFRRASVPKGLLRKARPSRPGRFLTEIFPSNHLRSVVTWSEEQQRKALLPLPSGLWAQVTSQGSLYRSGSRSWTGCSRWVGGPLLLSQHLTALGTGCTCACPGKPWHCNLGLLKSLPKHGLSDLTTCHLEQRLAWPHKNHHN